MTATRLKIDSTHTRMPGLAVRGAFGVGAEHKSFAKSVCIVGARKPLDGDSMSDGSRLAGPDCNRLVGPEQTMGIAVNA